MNVEKIDKTLINKIIKEFSERKVAIYCRVSKSDNSQDSSIEYQTECLVEVVREHPN